MANMYEEHARDLLMLSDEYKCATMEFLHATKNKPERAKITLICAPLLSDGTVAWKYAKKDSKKVVEISKIDHSLWLEEWEKKTGLCCDCDPKKIGYEIVGCSAVSGTKHRTCNRCHGTGKRLQ